MFKSLLAFAGSVPNWVINSFPIIRQILMVLIAVAAICLIIVALIQPSEGDGGANVITGSNESFYAQNKANSRQGKLKRLTIALAIIIAVCVLIYFILTAIYRG